MATLSHLYGHARRKWAAGKERTLEDETFRKALTRRIIIVHPEDEQ